MADSGETYQKGEPVDPNEQQPYTVVVQLPSSYSGEGMGEEPIYVYAGSENEKEGQLYTTMEAEAGEEALYSDSENVHNSQEEDGSLSAGMTPVRIIANMSAKSVVWNHFGFVPLGETDQPDKRRVLCKLCLTEVPYSGNTTNLQFHLHRYHRNDLPEETTEAAKNWTSFGPVKRKPKVEKQSGGLEVVLNKQKVQRRSKRSLGVIKPGIVSEGPSTGQEIHWHSMVKQQLTTHIVRALVIDCLPLSCVEGPGLQSLIKMLDASFDSKTVEALRSQILPRMHSDERKSVCSAVATANSVSVSFEAWHNNDVNLDYIGVTCHFTDTIGNVVSKYVKTIELNPSEDPRSVSEKISRTFAEIPINTKSTLSGCTIAEQSAGLLGLVNSAVDMMQIPRVPCLPSAFQQATVRLLQVSTVDTSLRKIRAIVNYIHKNSEMRSKYCEKIKECHVLVHKNVAFALVYQGLRKVLETGDVFTTAISERSDERSIVPLDDKDYSTVSAVVLVLQPFMDSAETISGELFPSISIILPLLYKVANMALTESEDDTPLSTDLKHSTRSYLRSVYSRDQNQLYLRTAMYLDPRLKTLPFFTEDEKADIQALLRTELTKVIKKSGTVAFSARSAPTPKKPKLASLLGDMFPGVQESPGPKDSSGAFADNIARSEITCYDNEDAVSLDETQPLRWWKAREGQYKFLSKMARKLLSISSTSIPTRRFLTVEGIRWAERRTQLPPEDVADVVFLGELFTQEG